MALYLGSLRAECLRDLEGTLKEVATMGFGGVEFAGFFRRDATVLKKTLDDLGLKNCAAHVALEDLLGPRLKETAQYCARVGASQVILSGLTRLQTQSPAAWERAALLFVELSARLHPFGVGLAYHPEAEIFRAIGDWKPLVPILGWMRKEVKVQWDTSVIARAGEDVVGVLKRYADRGLQPHLAPYAKDRPEAMPGDDDQPWSGILSALESGAGSEWHVLRYDGKEFAPLEGVRRMLAGYRKVSQATTGK